ncbi:type II toxin-antitoxin system VapC family toxin [Candidatus Sumerlaeota bacterium]|nr:type II toxin-antitoxin system VapC family toxin [Candidatus Sumerlaeota bacterium]
MSMTFDDIPEGAAVLLDSNIFVYAFAEKSPECSTLIQRCKGGKIFGVVSVFTLAEVCHKTMGIEAAALVGRSAVPAKYLKDHPETTTKLTRYASFMEDVILRCNLGIVESSDTDLLRSQAIRNRYGMLTTDSINVQVLLEYGIPAIATNDMDFERIEGIRVFMPGDIE